MRRFLTLVIALCAFGAVSAASAKEARQAPAVERNVIYGMHSGLALLLDVHRPAKPNGFGVVFVAGSGWQTELEYGATPLKERQIPLWGPPLLAAGYTVFAINHRAAPRFAYPAAIDDVQRAIRFVRSHARDYGIDAVRIGGVGGSSGAHLVGLAAMLGTPGNPDDADPVNRESAALTAVVLRAPPLDLRTIDTLEGTAYVVSFMDAPVGNASFTASYVAASPITHVTTNSPPVLLLHGDADKIIPYSQSVAMKAALEAANVPVKLVTIPGGAHGADFGAAQPAANWPDYFGETVSWLDRYVRGR
jgi:acetyl esterase/lipase